MASFVFDIKSGYITWNGRSYRAISGPFKKGSLETGKYRVENQKVVTDITHSASFQSTSSRQGWFIPLIPLFESDRTGLGIHPDGGQRGTEGCIGIQGQSADLFWKAWQVEPIQKRPSYLTVVEGWKR